MDGLRMAITGADQAVHRVKAALAEAPITVRAMAGRELTALAAALDAILLAQRAIVLEVERMRGARDGV